MSAGEGTPAQDPQLSLRSLVGGGAAAAIFTGLAIVGIGDTTASAAAGETAVTARCDGEEVVLDTSFYNDPNIYGVTLDSVDVQYLELSAGTAVAEDLPSGDTAEVVYNTGLSSVEGGEANFSVVALGGDFTDTVQVEYGPLDCEELEPSTTTTLVTTTTGETTTTTGVPTTSTTSTTIVSSTTSAPSTTVPGTTIVVPTTEGTTTTAAPTTTSVEAPQGGGQAQGAEPVEAEANFTG